MKINFYKNPQNIGWLGWIDGENDRCIGFVKLDGTIQLGW